MFSSFLQTPEWGKWQEKYGWTAHTYSIDNEASAGSEKTTLTAHVLFHSLPSGFEYAYIPYGPICDADKEETRTELLEKLIGEMKQDHKNLIFIRLEPQDFGFNLSGIRYKVASTTHIQPGSTIINDLTQTEEILLSSMHPKTRYNIKVAEKHGVEIRKIINETEKNTASAMLFDTLNRRGLSSHSANYYKNIMGFFNQLENSQIHTTTYAAFLNNQMLTCAIMLDYKNTRTYLFGGSSMEHKNLMAPYLLHWKAFKDAKATGLDIYDWFGAEGATSTGAGFAKFKLGFGGTKVQYPKPQDVVIKPLAYSAYKLFRIINRLIRRI